MIKENSFNLKIKNTGKWILLIIYLKDILKQIDENFNDY